MGSESNVAAPRGPIPYLIVSSAPAAIEFYKATLGAIEVVRLVDAGGKVAHAELRLGEGSFMLADEFPEMGYRAPSGSGGTPVSLLFYVDDVDSVFVRCLAAGGTVIAPVSDQFDGDRRGTLLDPFGHVWLLATKQEAITHEEVRARFQRLVEGAGD